MIPQAVGAEVPRAGGIQLRINTAGPFQVAHGCSSDFSSSRTGYSLVLRFGMVPALRLSRPLLGMSGRDRVIPQRTATDQRVMHAEARRPGRRPPQPDRRIGARLSCRLHVIGRLVAAVVNLSRPACLYIVGRRAERPLLRVGTTPPDSEDMWGLAVSASPGPAASCGPLFSPGRKVDGRRCRLDESAPER